MKIWRTIALLLFFILCISVYRSSKEGQYILYAWKFNSNDFKPNHRLLQLLGSKYRTVPYSSIKAEINTVDTFYVLNHVNGKSLIFRLDKLNSIDIKNIIEYEGDFFQQIASMENSKLNYNYPSNRNVGLLKVDSIFGKLNSECGKQLSISLDGIVWNYVFHFDRPTCIHGNIEIAEGQPFLCIDISNPNAPASVPAPL